MPFTWCLWNKICWWKLVFNVRGHNCRCLIWETMEASVSPVGVNGLMEMFYMSHSSFSAGDIVYLHFHVTEPGIYVVHRWCWCDTYVTWASVRVIFRISISITSTSCVLLCSVWCRVVFLQGPSPVLGPSPPPVRAPVSRHVPSLPLTP